jgi:hypothetical protein
VAIRPKQAYVPKVKAIARTPVAEQVYLVAYGSSDMKSLPRVSEGKCCLNSGVATYDASSSFGDCCGGVWAVANDSTQLVGFHNWGSPSKNGFIPITKELLACLSGSSVFRESLL